jgi:16S rRNA (guanine966-N2)-methyltransferase
MNRVRVISGALKNRKIATPSQATHPMGDRDKLALFNAIHDYIPDAVVLDVFAGSGALGIESLSRGAALATFVEIHPSAIAVIKQNLVDLGLLSRATIAKTLPDRQLFNVIFADPPYRDPQCSIIVRLPDLLAPSGLLIISHAKNLALPSLPLTLLASKSYAGATISIYQNTTKKTKSS